MSESEKTTEQLIDDVISFIERERELFGEFSVDYDTESITTQDIKQPKEKLQKSDSEIQKTAFSEKEKQSKPNSNMEELSNSGNDLFKENDTPEVYQKIGECKSLDELKELCKGADVLRTDLEGTQLVFGVGNPDADLMLIGEAPGEEEDKQGEPFVGRAGKLLNKILAAIDLKRDDVYIANILKHRPPNNRNPKPEERERSLPFLLRQIDLINPKLILALGKVAAQTLLDSDKSLTKMRGQFHSFRGDYELLATYHPAALLRNPNWKRPTWEDMQKLRKRYDELECSP